MAVYNGQEYLKEAVNSVLSQTFIDFEFIIIDDCSLDNTQEIIKSFDDKRIKLFRNKINKGRVYRAINSDFIFGKRNFFIWQIIDVIVVNVIETEYFIFSCG